MSFISYITVTGHGCEISFVRESCPAFSDLAIRRFRPRDPRDMAPSFDPKPLVGLDRVRYPRMLLTLAAPRPRRHGPARRRARSRGGRNGRAPRAIRSRAGPSPLRGAARDRDS